MLQVGDYVWYIPYEDCEKDKYEKGRIKSISSDTHFVFVVFHCNNDWGNYRNYTGQRTSINQLIPID